MNNLKLKSIIGPALVLVAFIVYAAYILVGINSDVLYTAQDRNVYAGDALFLSQTMARPFGFFQYVGAYLTQLFYNPALGAGVLIAIWLAIFFAGVKAFRLKGEWCALMILPLACLLAATVDLGYWVYCLIIPGYWFSQSVALLCMLLMLWAADATPRRYRPLWYIVNFLMFPVFGWCTYLFAVCLALMQIRRDSTPTWKDGVGITLVAVAPLVFRAVLYRSISLLQVGIAGFPYFKTFTDESLRPAVPFMVIIGILVLLSIGGVFAKVSLKRLSLVMAVTVPVVIASLSVYGVWTSMFKDNNYLYEMQMNRATMDDDWDTVISIAEKTTTPSRTMVMLKNIALMNTGQLAERSFELGNSGVEINNPDSLNLNIMHIASPTIYYNHGMVNYAMRWCMELSVQNGFSPYFLKNMVRCAEATGEKELAQRYKKRLHSMLYYADWQPKKTTPVVKELKSLFADRLGDDENSCERYILKKLCQSHNVKSRLLTEISLVYSMIIRSTDNFWLSFCDYYVNQKGKKMPLPVDEAFCLFLYNSPAKIPYDVSPMPETVERYKSFMDAGNNYAQYYSDEESVGNALKDDWGNSYWWFNAFGRSAY